jgi:hypothetical protein
MAHCAVWLEEEVLPVSSILALDEDEDLDDEDWEEEDDWDDEEEDEDDWDDEEEEDWDEWEGDDEEPRRTRPHWD